MMSFCSHEMQQRDLDSEGKVRLAVSMETGDQPNDRADEEARAQVHQMNRHHHLRQKLRKRGSKCGEWMKSSTLSIWEPGKDLQ